MAGRDFNLAFSPERIDPGNQKFTTRTIPKVVGGVTPQCTEAAAALEGLVAANPDNMVYATNLASMSFERFQFFLGGHVP